MQTAAELYSTHSATKDDLSIETASGLEFRINKPEFRIEDIAHALSMQCRYTGHTRVFYSVAEHCLLVADLMERYGQGNPFEGLMHDAAEAYLSDIAAPWKVLLPDYKILEKRIETPLRQHFGLPIEMSPIVKEFDWVALFVEAYFLIPSRAAKWVSPPGVKERALEVVEDEDFELPLFEPHDAALTFLEYFERLRP
jgi:hypothetical protein